MREFVMKAAAAMTLCLLVASCASNSPTVRGVGDASTDSDPELAVTTSPDPEDATEEPPASTPGTDADATPSTEQSASTSTSMQPDSIPPSSLDPELSDRLIGESYVAVTPMVPLESLGRVMMPQGAVIRNSVMVDAAHWIDVVSLDPERSIVLLLRAGEQVDNRLAGTVVDATDVRLAPFSEVFTDCRSVKDPAQLRVAVVTVNPEEGAISAMSEAWMIEGERLTSVDPTEVSCHLGGN